jgi:hypothetical protein
MTYIKGKILTITGLMAAICTMFSSCGIYTFRDVSIPDNVKTIKINFIENRAAIINPQLAPKLTDQFKTTVQSYIKKASLVNGDNADYIISAYVSNYAVTTSGIGSTQATTNRLTVGVTMTLNNTLKGEMKDYTISRDFDFAASLTLTQAENQLLPDIIKNVSDEMFNRIFSSW